MLDRSVQVPQKASLDQEKRPLFNVINIGLKERDTDCLEITNYVSPGDEQRITRSYAGRLCRDLMQQLSSQES